MTSKRDATKQMRVRLPMTVIDRLQNREPQKNISASIVWYLDLAFTYEKEMLAMRKESSLSRAFGMCFSIAESVTGKSVDDPETCVYALHMVSAMARWMIESPQFRKTKHKAGRVPVQSAMHALMRLGELKDSDAESFRIALKLQGLMPQP